MPKTVQIRDIPDEVYAKLQRRAARADMSVPELLRREATRIANRPTMEEWLDDVRRGPSLDTASTGDDVIRILDEWRGPWPDADT